MILEQVLDCILEELVDNLGVELEKVTVVGNNG